MKRLLQASAAGLLLILPGVAVAAQVTFTSTAPQSTALSDANGSAAAGLSASGFYRSYDSFLSAEPMVVLTTPAPTVASSTADSGAGGDPVVSNPVGTTSSDPASVQTTTTAAVPLPAPVEMAGAGLAATMLFSWLGARRRVRARA